MSKRGQIAAFIILGIIIIAVVTFFLYTRAQIMTQRIAEEQKGDAGANRSTACLQPCPALP
jgi:hypothetical protein